MLRFQLSRGLRIPGLVRPNIPFRTFSSSTISRNILSDLKSQAPAGAEFEKKSTSADVFDELRPAAEEAGSGNKKKSNTVFDIDALIANSRDMQTDQSFSSAFDSYAFGETAKHPRDVAKEFNISGTAAGRTVDVKYGNVAQALRDLNNALSSNSIQTIKSRQRRYLRPALLRDLKHRKWWRKNFAVRFSKLLSEVSEAKRRGY